ncbi:MAG: DUF1963 domain-containing protein [Kiloniellales bacterium]|nr:DUF1963 domain-containing protein [Kiloniellales bacterium]
MSAPVTRAELEALKDKIASMRAPIMACLPQTGERSTRPDESRLGGWPCWPEDEALPKDANGEAMMFLAQINFAEMPPLEPFPESGLMQIFVSCGDSYGCKFPSRHRDGFTVHYRAGTDGLFSLDPYEDEGVPFSVFDKRNLHWMGQPFVFERRDMVPPLNHYLIEPDYDALWQRTIFADSDVLDELFEENPGPDIYLGGFPRFTQLDFRAPDRPVGYDEPAPVDLAAYDQVVMQCGAPEGVTWGDVGEACFLMRSEDLRKRAFDQAIYYWDCT